MLAQRLDRMVREQQRRPKVERKDAVEELRRHIVDRRARGVDSVVDEDVDLPNRLMATSISRRQSSTRTRFVSSKTAFLPSLFATALPSSPTASEDDLGSFFDKERGDRRTKTLCAAGDDRDLSRQELPHRSFPQFWLLVDAR